MTRGAGALVLVFALAIVWAGVSAAAAEDTYPRQPAVDALHYVFRLTLADASDEIQGEATVLVKVAPPVTEVALDLASAAGSTGMTVTGVTSGGRPVAFTHADNRLRIALPEGVTRETELSFTVVYHGVPANGLRFVPNVHGERTAFSENWPDRAREWLPTIDHPSDKATGEFVVTAPARYQVIANGVLVEQLDLDGDRRRTHWRQSVPIASWLYAVGVARFAVHHAGSAAGVPLQTWVYPQDRDTGPALFEVTSRRALAYFSEWIAPYPYEKLANVEAAGISGGTEHASAIFYGDKGVTGGRAPVVHEIAHQWWGNSVTERDWDDVWLSEGFATYFTLLFTEHDQGRDAFVAGLESSRARVVELERTLPDTPVIHRNLADMRRVLNQLVYQKGGWTLHMLRALVGTETFWTGIREYYRRFQNGHASTDEFRAVMEQASGRELGWFFAQWLTRAGIPRVEGTWRYDAARKRLHVELAQVQAVDPFRLTVDVGVVSAVGRPARIERVSLDGRRGAFDLPCDSEPADVTLDPGTWLLAERGTFSRAR